MNVVERAKAIILRPREEWTVIEKESTTTADLYKDYILPLAAIGPLASIVGMSLTGVVPLGISVGNAVVSYLLSLGGIYLFAVIINALAPAFSGQRNSIQALKVAAYSTTAAWLAGIFSLIPALSILGILGLYSLYLLYLGLPVLMRVPREKSPGYTVSVVVAALVLFWILWAISTALIPMRMSAM